MLDLPYAVLLLPLILLLLAIPTYLLLLRRPSYDPLADEFSHTSAATSPTCTIKALYIYPIKSCRGAPLRTSIVLSTGLSDDRQFLFAERDPSGQWHFITQRRHYPQLTHVVPTLDHVAERMHVSFPGSRRGFSVGLRQEGPVERVHIWKDEPEAYLVAGGEVVEGLKKFLGAKGELALFRVCQKREVFRCAPRRGEGIDYQPVVGFADAVSRVGRFAEGGADVCV